MYVRIVTFTLNGPAQAATEYRRHAEEIAPAFREWPGLIATAATLGAAQASGGAA